MRKDEFDCLTQAKEVIDFAAKVKLHLKEFTPDDLSSRTLLYGYDCDRNSWHVYSDAAGDIILYIYKDGSNDLREVVNCTLDGVNNLADIVPNKRLYPQYCDYLFCIKLRLKGIDLPFTVFDEPHADRFPLVGEVA